MKGSHKKRTTAKVADKRSDPASVSPPPSLPAETGDATTLPVSIERTTLGTFAPGQSGNPVGRIKGSKNYLSELRRTTEIAMRDYLVDDAHKKLCFRAIERLFAICIDGEEKNAVGALKLLLDKLMVSPRPEEEVHTGPAHITVVIENKTIRDQPPLEVIEGEFEEVTPNA